MIDYPPTDRRVIRTQEAIHQALISLIEEKGFDALTVRDITMRADINRGTFYLHYRDKFDLLEQTVSTFISDLEKIFLQANAMKLLDFEHIDQPLPAMVSMFRYFKENASLMKAIFGLKGDIDIQNRIKTVAEKNLKMGFLMGVQSDSFQVPSDYLISYVISAHLGVVQVWLQKGCIESPREMALILFKLSMDGPFRASGIGR